MAFTEIFEYDQNDSSLPGLDENQAIHIIDRIEAIAGLRNSISTLNDINTEINSEFPNGYDEFTDFITSSICGVNPPNQEWVTYEYFKQSLVDDNESPEYVIRFKTALCVIAIRDLQYLGPFGTSKHLNKVAEDGQTNKSDNFKSLLAKKYEEIISSIEDGVPISTVSIELNEIANVLIADAQIQDSLAKHFSPRYRDLNLFAAVSIKSYLDRARKVAKYLASHKDSLHLDDARIAVDGVLLALQRNIDQGLDDAESKI